MKLEPILLCSKFAIPQAEKIMPTNIPRKCYIISDQWKYL